MADVRVLVQNVVSQGDADSSVFFSPVWVGFHDGTFNPFDEGEAANEAIERLAEDAIFEPAGDFTETISTEFTGNIQGVIQSTDGPPFFQGNLGVSGFDVDETQDRFLSYASMILPSNDSFIANDDPTRENLEIFDENGNFLGTDFTVTGARVWDAGTEVNDEISENTAALGQTDAIEDANTGVDEDGTVQLHPGFLGSERLGGEAGGILDARADADFTTENDGADFGIARFTVLQDVAGATSGNDRLNGLETPDAIFGLAGDDTLNGFAGRDWIVGGLGSDLIRGGAGDDVLEGRTGFDILLGGSGNDMLKGGAGNDRLNGGAGNDTLMGGNKSDLFIFNTNQPFDTDDVGVDTITDFEQGVDFILLDLDTFDAITSVPSDRDTPGFSVASEFEVVDTDAAAATSDALIVHSTENGVGRLFYNENGAEAGFGDGGQFATVLPVLTVEDFILR